MLLLGADFLSVLWLGFIFGIVVIGLLARGIFMLSVKKYAWFYQQPK